MESPGVVLDYWFKELQPEDWFSARPELDTQIRDRFGRLHAKAVKGELFPWRSRIDGRLAEIIVLDQFSRNIFRGRPESLAQDAMALVLAQEAVATGQARQLDPQRRAFLYMPYMHSESQVIHTIARTLFSEPGLEYNLDFELRHWQILERFGRYPHRNLTLDRISTPEEIEFLKQPGSSF